MPDTRHPRFWRHLAAAAHQAAAFAATTLFLLVLAAACVPRPLETPGQQPAPAATSPAPAAHPETFRVMTYNIHHGEGVDGRIDLERLAASIRSERADLVALQEVDKGVERTARRDLPEELAALTGMRAVFSNNFNYQGGEYGNAVLTRFDVRRWKNTHLRMLREGEQRGVLQVVVSALGRDLLFLVTHIDYRPDDAERLMNVEQFGEVLAEYADLPAIFAGDFNDTPGSRTYVAMSAAFDDTWTLAGSGEGLTYPSSKPAKRIDFLWMRKGSPLRAVRTWVPRTEASDHLPLVAELAWQGETEGYPLQ